MGPVAARAAVVGAVGVAVGAAGLGAKSPPPPKSDGVVAAGAGASVFAASFLPSSFGADVTPNSPPLGAAGVVPVAGGLVPNRDGAAVVEAVVSRFLGASAGFVVSAALAGSAGLAPKSPRLGVADGPALGVAPNKPPIGLFVSVEGVPEAAGVAPSPKKGLGAVEDVVLVEAAGVAAPKRPVAGFDVSVEVVEAVAGVEPKRPPGLVVAVLPKAEGVPPNRPPGFGASVLVAAGVVVLAPGAGAAPNPKMGFGAVAAPVAGVEEAPNSPPPVVAGAPPKRLGFAGSVLVVAAVVEVGFPKEKVGLGGFVDALVLLFPNNVLPAGVAVEAAGAPKLNVEAGVVEVGFVLPNSPPVGAVAGAEPNRLG